MFILFIHLCKDGGKQAAEAADFVSNQDEGPLIKGFPEPSFPEPTQSPKKEIP